MKKLTTIGLLFLCASLAFSQSRQRIGTQEITLDTARTNHVGSAARMWFGDGSTPFYLLTKDSIEFRIRGGLSHKIDSNRVMSGAFSTTAGSIITGDYLVNGSVIADKLTTSSRKFTTNIIFSDSTYNIVKWTAGYIKLADSTYFTVAAGNATMTNLTYFYVNVGTKDNSWYVEVPHTNTGLMAVENDWDGIARQDNAKGIDGIRYFVNGRAYVWMDEDLYAPDAEDTVVVYTTSANKYSYEHQFNSNTELTAIINALPGLHASNLVGSGRITITASPTMATTTAWADIAGDNVVLLCVAKPASETNQKAFYVPSVPSGSGLNINGDQISGNSITAAKINVVQLASISSDLGAATAGSLVVGTTNKMWFNSAADGVLAVGGTTEATAPFHVDATGIVKVSNVNGSNTVTIDPAGTYAFASGPTSAPTFTVTPAGALTATSATIRGSLHAGDTDPSGTYADISSGGVLKISEETDGQVTFGILTPSKLAINGHEVWTDANDGTGSGLDADKLDGSHAVDFASWTHTHVALDITDGIFDVARIPALNYHPYVAGGVTGTRTVLDNGANPQTVTLSNGVITGWTE